MKFLQLIMVAFAVSLLVPDSKAQVTATTYGNFTLVPGAITNEVTVLTNSSVIAVHKDRGLAVLPAITGLDESAANVTFGFNVSADGTNYTTTAPLTCVVALNGTNAVVGWKQFDPLVLNNVRWIRLGSIVNAATNGVTIQRVQWSRANE